MATTYPSSALETPPPPHHPHPIPLRPKPNRIQHHTPAPLPLLQSPQQPHHHHGLRTSKIHQRPPRHRLRSLLHPRPLHPALPHHNHPPAPLSPTPGHPAPKHKQTDALHRAGLRRPVHGPRGARGPLRHVRGVAGVVLRHRRPVRRVSAHGS